MREIVREKMSTRARSVLGILTGFDALIALHGAMFASVALSGADTSGWVWSTWLLAAVVVVIPVLSIVAPLTAWLFRSGSEGTRLLVALVPIVLASSLYVTGLALWATQNL